MDAWGSGLGAMALTEPLPTSLISGLASSLVRVRATEEGPARADQARPSRDQGSQASGAAAHAVHERSSRTPEGGVTQRANVELGSHPLDQEVDHAAVEQCPSGVAVTDLSTLGHHRPLVGVRVKHQAAQLVGIAARAPGQKGTAGCRDAGDTALPIPQVLKRRLAVQNAPRIPPTFPPAPAW